MRIEWSPGVTEEQEDKVLDHMTHEKIKEIEWAHNYPLWGRWSYALFQAGHDMSQ